MFYRFPISGFIEAESFDEAVNKLVEIVKSHKEHPGNWLPCACVGFQHRFSCKFNPINDPNGDIPF